MPLSSRSTISRNKAHRHSRLGRVRGFESLESRQMLSAAPLASDDSFTIASDTSLQSTLPPEGEPVQASSAPAPPPAPIQLIIENVTIASRPLEPVEGFFDVYVDVAPGSDFSVAGYDASIIAPAGSGVTLVSAHPASAAHPRLFPSDPTFVAQQNRLNVTDALPTGAVHLDHGDGIFRVRFTVAPGAGGDVPLSFNPTFTNLADSNSDPLPIDRVAGVITIRPPLTTVTGTNEDDTYYVVRSGERILIYENIPPQGDPTYSSDLAAIGPNLTIDALGGNDTLFVSSGGAPELGVARLIYNAGTGANSLVLQTGRARIDSTAQGGLLDSTVQQGTHLSTNQLNQGGLTVGAAARATLLPGGPTSKLTSLSIGPGATLDITDNALVVDYAGASPVTTIRQQILSGRGGAGLGKPWNGTGITSSTAAQVNATAPDSRSVGFAENALLPLGAYANFRGQVVDLTSVLIAYTRTADANLDGIVNADDVTVVGANFAPGATKLAWALGNFEYNNSVDSDDVTLLGVFYNPAANPAPAPVPVAEGRRKPDNAPALALPRGGVIRGGSLGESSLPVPAQGSAWKPTTATRGFAPMRSSATSRNDDLIGFLAESIAAERAAPASTLANVRLATTRRPDVAACW